MKTLLTIFSLSMCITMAVKAQNPGLELVKIEKTSNTWVIPMGQDNGYEDDILLEKMNGCNIAAKESIKERLELIAQNHPDFSVNDIKVNIQFNAIRGVIVMPVPATIRTYSCAISFASTSDKYQVFNWTSQKLKLRSAELELKQTYNIYNKDRMIIASTVNAINGSKGFLEVLELVVR